MVLLTTKLRFDHEIIYIARAGPGGKPALSHKKGRRTFFVVSCVCTVLTLYQYIYIMNFHRTNTTRFLHTLFCGGKKDGTKLNNIFEQKNGAVSEMFESEFSKH